MSIHNHSHRTEVEGSTASATIGNASPRAGSLVDDKVESEKVDATSKEVPAIDVGDSLLDDIPDGGMRAWLVILGVCIILAYLKIDTHL